MSESERTKGQDGGLPEASRKALEMVRKVQASAAADPRFQKNPPTFRARCSEWVRRDYWTLDEATNLLVGTDPQRPYSIEGQDAMNREVQEMRALLQTSAIPSEGKLTRRYLGAQVIAWAKKKGLDIPSELLDAMGEKPKDKPVHGNAIKNEQNRQKVLGAALAAVVKYPGRCKDRGDKFTGRSIATFLEQRALDVFNGEAAPMSVDTMARLINKYLPDNGDR